MTDTDDKTKKKRNIDFKLDYDALANHIKRVVRRRSEPWDEFQCPCNACQRATFKGKVLPESEFQPIQITKPGGFRGDAGSGEGRYFQNPIFL